MSDFGLVRENARFPSAADFRFVLYRFDPRWGFRGAWQKLTEILRDYFVVRSREQGVWLPFTDEHSDLVAPANCLRLYPFWGMVFRNKPNPFTPCMLELSQSSWAR